MAFDDLNVVTGAFSYTGRYIARRLLAAGKKVRTLARRPDVQHLFDNEIEVNQLDFDDDVQLVRSLEGASTLYNTYWIRFPRGQITFDTAVENTSKLVRAAEKAGIKRIVHLSVTNASLESPFPYFRGKAQQEKIIADSKLSYAIIRPTLIFGAEDILLNNIAWLLRKLSVFAIPGSGEYRMQPVFVEDVAQIAFNAGSQNNNLIIDAAGPETFTFQELVRLIATRIRCPARIMRMQPGLTLFLARLISLKVKDVIITRDEILAIMSNLLMSSELPAGHTSLSRWLEENSHTFGIHYTSESQRHWR